MDIQNFGELPNSTGNFEKTDPVTNDPMVNSDPLSEKAPADAAVIHEMSFSGDVSAGAPVDSLIFHDTPLDETTPHEAISNLNVGSLAPLLNREDFRASSNALE